MRRENREGQQGQQDPQDLDPLAGLPEIPEDTETWMDVAQALDEAGVTDQPKPAVDEEALREQHKKYQGVIQENAEELVVRLRKKKCLHCKHQWWSALVRPVACPKPLGCGRMDWDQETWGDGKAEEPREPGKWKGLNRNWQKGAKSRRKAEMRKKLKEKRKKKGKMRRDLMRLLRGV